MPKHDEQIPFDPVRGPDGKVRERYSGLITTVGKLLSRKTISIDFDGVIHNYSEGWTGFLPEGAPVFGAKEFCDDLLNEGHCVVISSCRALTQIGRLGIKEWLEKHGFSDKILITSDKPHADCYIDDRAIRFRGDFEQVKLDMDEPIWFKKGEEPEFEP